MGIDRRSHSITYSLIGSAALSKVLGLVREVLFAQALGVTILADSYRGAIFVITYPLLFLGGDVGLIVLIPLYRQWRSDDAIRYTSLAAACFMFGMFLTGLFELFTGDLVRLFLNGSPNTLGTTTSFVRIMALSIPAIVLFNFMIAVEVCNGRAAIISLRSVATNLGAILGIFGMMLTGQPLLIAWGFNLAFLTSATWGLSSLVRKGEISVTVSSALMWPACREFLTQLRYIAVQPISEISQYWVERFLASATTGVIAALDYARTLTDITVVFVSQPVGLMLLADERVHDRSSIRRRIAKITIPLLSIGGPSSIFLIIFAPDVVKTAFARGSFGAEGVYLTSQAIIGIGLGLWSQPLAAIFIRQLNSEGRNGHAAVLYMATFGIGIVSNLSMNSMHLGPFGFGLSESIRSVVLLALTSTAIDCDRIILCCIVKVVPSCILFGAVAFYTERSFHQAGVRLGLGSLTLVLVVFVTMVTLMPVEVHTLWRRALRRTSS